MRTHSLGDGLSGKLQDGRQSTQAIGAYFSTCDTGVGSVKAQHQTHGQVQ